MGMSSIIWETLKDRHIKGYTCLGPVWIRTDQAGSVTGLYTCFGETTKKFVPPTDSPWSVNDAKATAELQLSFELLLIQVGEPSRETYLPVINNSV